ncbi:MAG: CBS domain-containing protein [Anaerolineae bacterium]
MDAICADDGAATASLLRANEITKAQELVYELKIGEVMTRKVVCVSPSQSMRELEETLRTAGVAGAPVIESGRLVAIVSMQDLIRALRLGRLEEPVRNWMTTDLLAVREDESVIEAVKAFTQRPVSRLPVVNGQGELVGILTGGDITRGLLRALDMGYRQEEISGYRASHIFQDIVSDDTSLTLRYRIAPRDFSRGGEASSRLKRALQRLGGRPEIVRRVSVATYEAEMNLVIHSDRGGEIVADARPDRIWISVVDDGPGIADVNAARQPGFSTAPEWIRELGFGAGMGLYNIDRCADEFRLRSQLGVGTELEIVVYLAGEERLGRRPA